MPQTPQERLLKFRFYPQAQVCVIPEAGHTVGMDKPEEYLAAVREFFDSRE